MSIREIIVKYLEKAIQYIKYNDDDYTNWASLMLHYHPHITYLQYKKAKREWDRLEREYGDWSTAYDNNPSDCQRLEDMLA